MSSTSVLPQNIHYLLLRKSSSDISLHLIYKGCTFLDIKHLRGNPRWLGFQPTYTTKALKVWRCRQNQWELRLHGHIILRPSLTTCCSCPRSAQPCRRRRLHFSHPSWNDDGFLCATKKCIYVGKKGKDCIHYESISILAAKLYYLGRYVQLVLCVSTK